jgi:hypothetical protein
VVNVFAATLLAYLFNRLSLDRPLLWRGVRRTPSVRIASVAVLAYTLVELAKWASRRRHHARSKVGTLAPDEGSASQEP